MKQEEFVQRFTYDPVADLLGEGGFGRVYRAYDNYEHEYVALKIQGVDPRHPELRLRNEVEKVQSHLHKNVARYKGVYTFTDYRGETDVAIMKYYNDGSLDKLLANGKLSREELFGLLTEILEGIAYLHSEGIIHRDLKPQNVLIVKHEGRYSPLITDFGISKQLDDGQSSAVSNSVLGGTRSYASPEQLKDSTIRKNTDLWSFGVIAFQMLVGKLPFDCGKYSVTSEEGRLELFRQMTSGVLPEALNDVPEPWQRLIRECLTVDNERRIAHAEDCLQILDTFKEVVPEPPVSPEPPAPEEEIYVAEVIEATPEDLATEPEPNPATEPEVKPNPEPKVESNPKSTKPKTKKRSKWWLWLLLLAIVGGGVFAYLNSQPKDNPEPTPEQPSQPTAPTPSPTQSRSNYTESGGGYGISMKMVWVEGGTFQMGSTNGDSDEQPVHSVTLSGYWIAETEVTQAQWEAVMGTQPSHDYGVGPNYPVYYVSYTEALEFCRRLSSATGKRYTLPTEAQWEYAARGGQRANGTIFTYSGSNTIGNVAWYSDNSSSQTHPVKQKAANQLGLYDMTGNVWEWCLDWYSSSYYGSSPQNNPQGPSSGRNRVLRGGGWDGGASYCRVAFRNCNAPSGRNNNRGFRVVCLP